MSKYTQEYITFSKTAYTANRELIDKWAKDDSRPELAEACRMMIEAAGGKMP